jgi:hypothetical protein
MRSYATLAFTWTSSRHRDRQTAPTSIMHICSAYSVQQMRSWLSCATTTSSCSRRAITGQDSGGFKGSRDNQPRSCARCMSLNKIGHRGTRRPRTCGTTAHMFEGFQEPTFSVDKIIKRLSSSTREPGSTDQNHHFDFPPI